MKTTHNLFASTTAQPRRRSTLLLGVLAAALVPALAPVADGAPPPSGLRPIATKSDVTHSEQGNFGLAGGGSGSVINPVFGGDVVGGGISISLGDCPADWDGDGTITSVDVSYYFNDYFADINDGTTVADFNVDNVTNPSDAVQFINAWFLGCW